MSAAYHVQANWDAEAGVWVSQSNIPGLVVEAATLAEFVELVETLAPELLADNADIDGGKGSHEKWRSPVNGRVFIVPRSKSRHTANEVLKQAGLPKAF